MPDFSKCANEECEMRNKCLRFTVLPSGNGSQSYTKFHPLYDEMGNFMDCDFFKPISKDKNGKVENN